MTVQTSVLGTCCMFCRNACETTQAEGGAGSLAQQLLRRLRGCVSGSSERREIIGMLRAFLSLKMEKRMTAEQLLTSFERVLC